MQGSHETILRKVRPRISQSKTLFVVLRNVKTTPILLREVDSEVPLANTKSKVRLEPHLLLIKIPKSTRHGQMNTTAKCYGNLNNKHRAHKSLTWSTKMHGRRSGYAVHEKRHRKDAVFLRSTWRKQATCISNLHGKLKIGLFTKPCRSITSWDSFALVWARPLCLHSNVIRNVVQNV